MAESPRSRIAHSGSSLSESGLITSYSNITKPKVLSDDQFNTWYNTVHIPDVLSTGAVTTAYRFRQADPESSKPYMAIYFVPDLAAIESKAFKNISMTHSSLPDGASIHDLAHFDTRIYSFTQEYVNEEQEPGLPFPNLLLAAMEPGRSPEMAADLDAWYRQEHLEQMSKEPGWRRSRRYNLLFNIDSIERAPSCLSLYEFDETAELGVQVQPLDPMTDWTKKCMQEAQRIEAGIYTKIHAGD
ncbi:hypothetical protein Vi05172_g10704 [Venturia inaequalis]|nr:hypothetical protein Vi05172_g10704 [Venturia inaequalis]